MVTGWYHDDYLDSVDGAMAEGFFTYGGKLTGSDWTLSAGRMLQYLTGSGRNKVLIAQCSPNATDIAVRRWCIANYFLLKNKYSYYNLALSSTANWWPEYTIDLDSFLTQPSTLNDLLVPGTTSLYRRDFKNGMVLVNPGTVSRSLITAQRFQPVSFSGGGDVIDGNPPSMSVVHGPAVTGSITVAAGDAVILQREGAATRPGRPSSLPLAPQSTRYVAYSLTGRPVAAGRSRPNGLCAGVYVIRCISVNAERTALHVAGY
jgi:hypothetical protein